MDYFGVLVFFGQSLYVAGPMTSVQCTEYVERVKSDKELSAGLSSSACVAEEQLDAIAANAKKHNCRFVTVMEASAGVKIAAFACDKL